MKYLGFELSEGDEGVATLEAMASTQAEHHSAVLAEAQQVLDWARQRFPHTHGPVEEGNDWHDDLQVQAEQGGWFTVTLTLVASPRFAEAFFETFGPQDD